MTTTGVYTLHILFRHMLSRFSFHERKFESTFWEEQLEFLNKDIPGVPRFFEDDFWRGSPDENNQKGRCTVYGTSMKAFNELATSMIEAWDSHHFS